MCVCVLGVVWVPASFKEINILLFLFKALPVFQWCQTFTLVFTVTGIMDQLTRFNRSFCVIAQLDPNCLKKFYCTFPEENNYRNKNTTNGTAKKKVLLFASKQELMSSIKSWLLRKIWRGPQAERRCSHSIICWLRRCCSISSAAGKWNLRLHRVMAKVMDMFVQWALRVCACVSKTRGQNVNCC